MYHKIHHTSFLLTDLFLSIIDSTRQTNYISGRLYDTWGRTFADRHLRSFAF